MNVLGLISRVIGIEILRLTGCMRKIVERERCKPGGDKGREINAINKRE